MQPTTGAVVGVAGGAGATRLTVEFGAVLARDGRDVALLDAAYATQGLARHVEGRIDPDVTAIATGDADGDLDDALAAHPAAADLPGDLAVASAYAPFERIARAKAPEAARNLAALAAEAADAFDHVLLDTPPVAANQALAAVDAADRVALVYPATDRGVDALQRTRGRLADVGASVDLAVANRTDGDDVPPDADRAVPASDATTAVEAPACLDDADPLAPAVAGAAAALFEADLDVEVGTGLVDAARRRLR
ncbi:MAG: ParA family protein [Halorientalis sp.]